LSDHPASQREKAAKWPPFSWLHIITVSLVALWRLHTLIARLMMKVYVFQVHRDDEPVKN
jgi:hypothetical protein